MGTIKDYKNKVKKEEEAYNYYVSKGWLPHQALGIVGNLLHESDLNTNAEGDIGYKGGSSRGLAQWRGKRLESIKQRYGNNWTDFKNQLEFVDWELRNTHKKAGEALKEAKDVDNAGRIFSDLYEIPAKKWNQAKDRRDKVYRLSEKFKGELQINNKGITNDFIDFEIPTNNSNFATVPDVYKEEENKSDETIQEVKNKTNEYNFLTDLYNQEPQTIQEQPQEQQIIPQTDVLGTFNSVSKFVDSPLMQQGGSIKVSSKKDPRYLAYIDSLTVYNGNKYARDYYEKNIKPYFNKNNEEDLYNKWYSEINGEYIDNADIAQSRLEKLNNQKYNFYKTPTTNGEKYFGINDAYYPKQKVIVENKIASKNYLPKVEEVSNLKSQGIKNFDNSLPQEKELSIKEKADIPKSYNVEYSSQRLNGNSGYYNGNNLQNVDLTTVIRALEQADRQNNYFKEKYEGKNSTEAKKRLSQLKDEVIITPNYQQGGKVSKKEIAFLSELSIKDNKGQYNNPGKITEISSPNITMKGINKPIIGISKETGEIKTLYPELDYFFKNTKNVIEIPIK